MIACLAWGSLEWDPRKLPVTRPWRTDGPLVPVEFLRQSDGNRITLVLSDGVELVRSVWSPMDVSSLPEAVEALRQREGPIAKDNIGRWSTDESDPRLITGPSAWASPRGVQHIVWTALGPKFAGERGRVPTADEVVEHLKSLRDQEAAEAETYVRRAPAQIDTAFRRRIANELGWTPRSE